MTPQGLGVKRLQGCIVTLKGVITGSIDLGIGILEFRQVGKSIPRLYPTASYSDYV